jgi:DNA-binding NarL/FixJ family response regulator
MSPAGTRALVVEDDHSWQGILAEILTDIGYAVDTANNLDESIARMRSEAHVLAVVDLSLGSSPHNQDGLHVLDGLRRFDPKCKSIMLTGYATVELAVSAIAGYGALTCLRKEIFNRAEFRQLARQVLAGATPADLPQAEPLTQKITGQSSTGREDSGSPTPETQARAASGDGWVSKGLVLVVEDDAGWRSILSEMLADAGFQVRACGSFGESLGYLRREKYVLAVVDLSLTDPLSILKDSVLKNSALKNSLENRSKEPKYDGYRLLASTRAGGIPTIVVSGVLAPEEIERTYTDQGIFAFLQKQAFSRHVFLKTVEEALVEGKTSHELDILTEREREVLKLLAQGLTNKEIADALVISTNTVKRHLKAIFDKLEVHTRSAAATKATML